MRPRSSCLRKRNSRDHSSGIGRWEHCCSSKAPRGWPHARQGLLGTLSTPCRRRSCAHGRSFQRCNRRCVRTVRTALRPSIFRRSRRLASFIPAIWESVFAPDEIEPRLISAAGAVNADSRSSAVAIRYLLSPQRLRYPIYFASWGPAEALILRRRQETLAAPPLGL
jgi:hypothetical protein